MSKISPDHQSVRFSVQAPLLGPASAWSELAGKLEELRFWGLFVSDHPGNSASPFVALAGAASATRTLKLGTYVLNMGARDPLYVAADVATLDLVSDGRAILGVGAGHTPAEWSMFGRAYPSPKERVARLKEAVIATQRLLRGETVTHEGEHVRLDEAKLVSPLPIQDPIPLLIGGNNLDLVAFAAERADIVALSGLGRTLTGGHLHEMLWAITDLEKRLNVVTEHAQAAGRQPTINCLIYHVELTSDREQTADNLIEQLKAMLPQPVEVISRADVLETPFLLIGSEEDMVQQLLTQRERWGISSYTVRAEALDLVAPLIQTLSVIR